MPAQVPRERQHIENVYKGGAQPQSRRPVIKSRQSADARVVHEKQVRINAPVESRTVPVQPCPIVSPAARPHAAATTPHAGSLLLQLIAEGMRSLRRHVANKGGQLGDEWFATLELRRDGSYNTLYQSTSSQLMYDRKVCSSKLINLLMSLPTQSHIICCVIDIASVAQLG